MRVVMVSKTALAGAPYEAMKCLNKYSDVKVRWVAMKTDYADGRVFPADLLWLQNEKECRRVIKEADIVHMQNEPFPWAEDALRGKRAVVQFHSCPARGSFEALRCSSTHCYTLTQPMQQRVYVSLPGLPNLIDPEDYVPVTSKNRGRPIIIFAPTNLAHRDVLGSKASKEVTQILKRYRSKAAVDIYSNLNYIENLRRKQNADIIIDDVIGNTFHRTTLEGSCYGLAVLTSYVSSGCLYTTLETLPKMLDRLIDNKEVLKDYQEKSRNWIVSEWHPKDKVGMYVDAYKKVLHG